MDLALEQVADPVSSVGVLEETRFVGSPPMDAASIQLLPMVSVVVPKFGDLLQEVATVDLRLVLATSFLDFVLQWVAL